MTQEVKIDASLFRWFLVWYFGKDFDTSPLFQQLEKVTPKTPETIHQNPTVPKLEVNGVQRNIYESHRKQIVRLAELVNKLRVLAEKELSEFSVFNKLHAEQNHIKERWRWLSHADEDEKEDVLERLTEIGSLTEERT
jgi:hypothetical protein